MPVERELRVEQRMAAPAAKTWARLSDHEGTPTFIEQVKRVRIVEAGQIERGGLGAVREVAFKPLLWSTILERITLFESPKRFSYVLFSGMPGLLAHEGRVSVEPIDEATCIVRWEVDFRFRSFHWFRVFLPSFLRDFEAVLRDGLRRLKEQLEA